MHMNKDLLEAKKRLIEGGYTCVVMKNEQICTSTERGVKPLLAWLDDGVDLQGYSAADKVIGKGAAMLYVLLGVKEIYTTVISKPAKSILEQYGIEVSYDQCVEGIRNRTNTGLCPMEEAVKGIHDPKEALQVMCEKMKSMNRYYEGTE